MGMHLNHQPFSILFSVSAQETQSIISRFSYKPLKMRNLSIATSALAGFTALVLVSVPATASVTDYRYCAEIGFSYPIRPWRARSVILPAAQPALLSSLTTPSMPGT